MSELSQGTASQGDVCIADAENLPAGTPIFWHPNCPDDVVCEDHKVVLVRPWMTKDGEPID